MKCVCFKVNFKNLNQANDLLHFVFYFKRLASLLIVTQMVNQATEVVIPFLMDRLLSAPHRTESEEDPEEDKFRNQSTLPAYPVSLCPILLSLLCHNTKTVSNPCVGHVIDVYLFMFNQFYSWEIKINY